jgi:hypothetical protein
MGNRAPISTALPACGEPSVATSIRIIFAPSCPPLRAFQVYRHRSDRDADPEIRSREDFVDTSNSMGLSAVRDQVSAR